MNSAPFDNSINQTDLRFLIEKNADGIIVVDGDGIVLFANPATEHIFGRPPSALIGSSLGVPIVSGETTEIVIHRADGGHVDAEIRAVDTRWGNCSARLATVRDVSSRKTVEEQLRHTTKMEAVGRLTAGIAHDFNNLLTVVLGNLELAQRRRAEDSLPRMLENAMRGARRAALLTERLLAFSRKKPLEPKTLNINELVFGMSELLQRTLGEAITVKTNLTTDIWAVQADPTELEAAVLNLAVNARDAMPSGGTVVIETANVELDASYASINTEVAIGSYALISVSDTGTGMTTEVLNQVFEPFFTTKPHGQGTGLGLSQVYGFVKQSGGHVKLYSEPGIGTTVKIYLPRMLEVDSTDQAPSPAKGALLPVAQPGETVLVVEDDEDVRNYTVASLRDLGYTVVEAGDAISGLNVLQSQPGVALLFTDLGLPGKMDGKALADKARLTCPDLKVLITTAYAGSALIHEGRLDRGVELLTKPFTFSSLASRIRELLDRERVQE